MCSSDLAPASTRAASLSSQGSFAHAAAIRSVWRPICRLAAENSGQIDLVDLRYVLTDVEAARAGNQIDRLRALTGEFQLAVFRAARNERLYRLLKHLQEHMRQISTSTLTVPGRGDEVVTYCRDLVAAIASRDPKNAERIARENRRRMLELRLRILRNNATVA